MTINRTTILKKQNLCRNVGTIVEGLKRCLSVGIRILTCIGADNVFVGHKSEDGREQLLIEHLNNTAKTTGCFAEEFGAKEVGEILGLYHDIGKYSVAFQKRILEDGPKVDHSTAGAIEIAKNGLGLLGFCIAGHHAGLPDGGSQIDTREESTMHARLKRVLTGNLDYTEYKKEVAAINIMPSMPNLDLLGNKFYGKGFFIRMLFSCLVDADFLDTEQFMTNKQDVRGRFANITTLSKRLEEHIAGFWPPLNELNGKRCDILKNCIDAAEENPGLFNLTVPTGGGKTIASLSFALKHAEKYQKKRVIYVIPYTSIIEQNAEVFSKIVGEENVIEHHMNVVYEDEKEEINPKQYIKKLATENWDAPIIVTTNVQFFESLHSNKTSRCRKLHNIANSVIIFDEAQMFPVQYLKPCVRSIADLIQNYGVTAVLCSATQPTLDKFFPAKVVAKEICSEVENLYKYFQRTSYEAISDLDLCALTKRLNRENQVLCIVNTKKEAQNIFELLDGENCFHLSTFMYPEHRKKILGNIKKCLKEGIACRVVSTSLIEAGVDIDFPVVYREIAGLDSIIQAAGRCNREGKRKACDSKVFIYQLLEENGKSLRANNRQEIEITKIIEREYQDISSPEAIAAYFNKLHGIKGEALDSKGIIAELDSGKFPFARVGKEFVMIEDVTRPIFIPEEEEAKDIERRLRNGERSRGLFRRMGKYVVNVYEKDFEKLFNIYKVEKLDETVNILIDLSIYDASKGLMIKNEDGEGLFT